jgi:hypothetical protein
LAVNGNAITVTARSTRSIEIICDDGDVVLSNNFFDLNADSRTVCIESGHGTQFRAACMIFGKGVQSARSRRGSVQCYVDRAADDTARQKTCTTMRCGANYAIVAHLSLAVAEQKRLKTLVFNALWTFKLFLSVYKMNFENIQ